MRGRLLRYPFIHSQALQGASALFSLHKGCFISQGSTFIQEKATCKSELFLDESPQKHLMLSFFAPPPFFFFCFATLARAHRVKQAHILVFDTVFNNSDSADNDG